MSRSRLHPDVIWVARADGSSRLLHMGANTCALDAPSTALLRKLLESGSDGLAAELSRTHQGSEDEVESDIVQFVRALRREKILIGTRGRVSFIERALAAGASLLLPIALKWAIWKSDDLLGQARRLLTVARWAIVWFGWAQTLEIWLRSHSQPGRPQQSPQEIDEIVREAAARHWLKVHCKERALACFALARRAGLSAEVVVGWIYMPLAGHVWVESNGLILSDEPEHCRPYQPVIRHC